MEDLEEVGFLTHCFLSGDFSLNLLLELFKLIKRVNSEILGRGTILLYTFKMLDSVLSFRFLLVNNVLELLILLVNFLEYLFFEAFLTLEAICHFRAVL